jgi:hypothetical protein
MSKIGSYIIEQEQNGNMEYDSIERIYKPTQKRTGEISMKDEVILTDEEAKNIESIYGSRTPPKFIDLAVGGGVKIELSDDPSKQGNELNTIRKRVYRQNAKHKDSDSKKVFSCFQVSEEDKKFVYILRRS